MISLLKLLKSLLGLFGVTLGSFWRYFWVPWASFGHPLGSLGDPWAPFGLTLGPLGSLWAHFGAPLVSLWMPWAPFGVILDRLGSFLWCLGSQMQALGIICKSSHDVLDILSNNIYFLLYFALSSFATRYDRIMSEMFSPIVDFCLYIFAAIFWGFEFMNALPVPMLRQVYFDPLKWC